MSIKRIWAWGPVIAWMGVIFGMSAMPGDVSGEQSGMLMQLIFSIIGLLGGEQLVAKLDVQTVEFLIRKAAHMAEYAVLFWLCARALGMQGVRRYRVAALGLCAAYACGDEFHQSFVDGRGPAALDVLIDTAGASLAWLLAWLWGRARHIHRALRAGGRS